MKNLESIDVRLTDALERELLQEAIDNQQSYALDRAIVRAFHKIARLFKAPEVQLMHHTARTAH
jgi:hypothetical protein